MFQWADLMSGKPDDDYEDPVDVAAIREARENMGDYKLKSAADYVVPDHLRMNTEKAKSRLLVLKDLVRECHFTAGGLLTRKPEGWETGKSTNTVLSLIEAPGA